MLTQLCLAVALLALHMESWLTVVPDLISNLTTPPEQAAVKLPCLLELLTVLPEEVENFKVGIMPRRRQAFREMLKAEPLNPDPNPDPDPNPNAIPNPIPNPNPNPNPDPHAQHGPSPVWHTPDSMRQVSLTETLTLNPKPNPKP